MKTKILAAFLASAAALAAAPLTATTAAHTRPDDASPVITILKAGTEPTAAAEAVATTPAGWLAVELPGPFEGYVLNKDILKNLDVRLGAPVQLAPKTDAGVFATFEAADKSEITGLHGKWTQIRLDKKLTGYIRIGNAPGYLPPVATKPAVAAPAPVPLSPAPVAATGYGVAPAGQPAPVVNLGGPGLARLFAGKLVSTRSPFHPRRPFDWALDDDAGKRFAFLDLSRLLLTEQIESYVDHTVVVFGAAKQSPDGKDLVIEVESLQLK